MQWWSKLRSNFGLWRSRFATQKSFIPGIWAKATSIHMHFEAWPSCQWDARDQRGPRWQRLTKVILCILVMAKVQVSGDVVQCLGGTVWRCSKIKVTQIQQVDCLFAFLPCLLFWAKALRKTTMIMTQDKLSKDHSHSRSCWNSRFEKFVCRSSRPLFGSVKKSRRCTVTDVGCFVEVGQQEG